MLKVYNSLSRKKEEFRADNVGIYVCGITPYDITHVGHAFTYVFFDVVVRYLRFNGFKVKYIQNITDIDDDILKRSRELNENWRELAEKNSQLLFNDMKWLNNLQPDNYPRSTDHIDDMIEFIKKLLKRGYAYEKKGSVYFSIDKDKEYGKLSRLSKKEMLIIANERGNFPDDPNKQDPLDFVLWQKQKRGEPSWDSPWGKGRPGWHIECSAMSMKYLGSTIDIHGGGADLEFPHHESSIAQSEKLTGKPFVRYWMHTAMVRYEGEKMSKSLGNMVFIKELRDYSPNVVRLLLLSHYYRKPWEFNKEELDKFKAINENFRQVWLKQSDQGEEFDYSSYSKRFFDAMDNDFNTSEAVDALSELSEDILRSENNVAGAKGFLNIAFNILGLVVEYV